MGVPVNQTGQDDHTGRVNDPVGSPSHVVRYLAGSDPPRSGQRGTKTQPGLWVEPCPSMVMIAPFTINNRDKVAFCSAVVFASYRYLLRSTSGYRTRLPSVACRPLSPVASTPILVCTPLVSACWVQLVALSARHQEDILAPIDSCGQCPHDVGRAVDIDVRIHHDAPLDVTWAVKAARAIFLGSPGFLLSTATTTANPPA